MRENGFYWVQFIGSIKWTIMYWFECEWLSVYEEQRTYKDEDFFQIDETRLVRE